MSYVFKLSSFVRPYWRWALIALVLLTILVFLDLSIPRLIQRIIDQGINQGNQQVVIQTGLLMLGISLVSALIAVGNNIYSVRVGESVARDLREAIFLQIQRFAYGDLDRQQTGQLMIRLTVDASALQRLTQITLRIGTRAPLLMLGSMVLMFATSPRLALIMLPLLLVTAVIVGFFVFKMEPLFHRVREKMDRLNTVLQENVAGVRVVKSFVRDEHEAERFGAANQEFTDQSIRVMHFMATMSPILTMCVNAGMVLVIWAGGMQSIDGDLSVGEVVAFTNYLLTTITPLTMMAMLANVWASGIASAERVDAVLATMPEVQDSPTAADLPAEVAGRVVFENVAFAYNGAGSEPVLQGIDLVAEAGQSVAILGATGAGKTSLVNLVPRFYDTEHGRVLIDGADVRTLRQDALLQHIAIVPQETILFSGSVRDNIRYGAPQATDAEVLAAAQAAQAHDFIQALPRGYDTHVEERGVNLSGGQKQRIAIARALLMRPRILILDDSTSAVDVDTETRIQDALAAAKYEHTSLVVAQRISTVLRADKIVVLEHGRVAAQGTHQELMVASPIYREIYASQLGDGVGLAAGGAA
ncbi:MAG: ABC transporter ATP-binding protein/permease [Caldilinea sp.]|nr:ABC transporter ATP-binding protein [Caldilinea sp.]MCB0146213.1 ABC transporter ATP-binding protein [Caldilineaceae bacterium]MCO5211852.1 ABC transporter ATP-binding protein/permease [Caldilinea sp.]MCW5842488.1 ABC transporter ATP-binding protein [Caldilinea sp.]